MPYRRSNSANSFVHRIVDTLPASTQSAWSAAALGAALEDPDFDVRRHVVRGLEDIAGHGVHLPIDRQLALSAAVRELGESAGVSNPDRVEHALRLLGLVYDREAFRLAAQKLSVATQFRERRSSVGATHAE